MRDNPKGIRFAELEKVCTAFFGQPRQNGTSHRTFRTALQNQRVVIQPDHNGMAKTYQVAQVLKAIDMTKQEGNNNDDDDND